jgi:glycosyltransferase involved in cell wall biosynthesis
LKLAASRASGPKLSVVIPAYNEARTLPALLAALKPVLESVTAHWEVIVVDDGSRDETAFVLQPWLVDPGIRYLRLSRNFGKEAALTAGMDHAGGDVVLLMDGDGQHPPAMIPTLIESWRAGADMVCAVRASRADESWAKRVGTRWFYRVVNAGSQIRVPEDAGDFRLLDRRVVDALKALPERNRFMKGLYAWVGFDSRTVAYTPERRLAGRSHFSLRRLARLAFTGITAFTNFPLRVWSGIGALIAFAALGYGAWVVVEHFIEGHPVPGWPTLVAGLMFFSGVQLLSIGILGEYIGRIFDEVKQRPLYFIASESGIGALGDSPTAMPGRVAELSR